MCPVILKSVAQIEAIVITQQMRARYAMLTIGFGASELLKRKKMAFGS
jgi:hypothetical protein